MAEYNGIQEELVPKVRVVWDHGKEDRVVREVTFHREKSYQTDCVRNDVAGTVSSDLEISVC